MSSEEDLGRLQNNSMQALEEKVTYLKVYANTDRSRFDPNHLSKIVKDIELAKNEHKQSCENYIAHLTGTVRILEKRKKIR